MTAPPATPTERLRLDPQTKQQIKDVLYETLYAPIQDQFETRLHSIIIKNTIAGKYTHRSFIYRNEIYNMESGQLPRKMNRLLPQFQPEMDAYLRDVKRINLEELPFTLGFINQVLNSSNELHDYLRILPNAVHGPVQHLINTCPCRARSLTQDEVDTLIQNNISAIDLLRERMATNLLI